MSYTILKRHGAYNRKRRTQDVRYIVLHYTGSGGTAKGAALANCQYFGRANRNASAHYFVDDGSIYEYADPREWYTWHCGDGHGKHGITNANSIGIEVCQSGDRPYTSAEVSRVVWLVRHLMDEFGIDADHVVRHWDASRKACPLWYTPEGSGGNDAWGALKARIMASAVYKGYDVYRVRADGGLNCRESASASAKVTRTLPDGGTVNVASIADGWAKTQNGDYCKASFLAKASTTPYVVTAQPTLVFRTGASPSYKTTRTVEGGRRIGVVKVTDSGWALTSKGDWCNADYIDKLTKMEVDAEGGLWCRKKAKKTSGKTRLLKDGSAVWVRSIADGWAKTQNGDYCNAKYLK